MSRNTTACSTFLPHHRSFCARNAMGRNWFLQKRSPFSPAGYMYEGMTPRVGPTGLRSCILTPISSEHCYRWYLKIIPGSQGQSDTSVQDQKQRYRAQKQNSERVSWKGHPCSKVWIVLRKEVERREGPSCISEYTNVWEIPEWQKASDIRRSFHGRSRESSCHGVTRKPKRWKSGALNTVLFSECTLWKTFFINVAGWEREAGHVWALGI